MRSGTVSRRIHCIAHVMSNMPNPDLIKVTEIFLIPSSFLVAALGTADTNPHRAAVSLLGLIISGMWRICCQEALAEPQSPQTVEHAPPSRRIRIFSWLPLLFVVGWMVSLIAHLVLWSRPLGQ